MGGEGKEGPGPNEHTGGRGLTLPSGRPGSMERHKTTEVDSRGARSKPPELTL